VSLALHPVDWEWKIAENCGLPFTGIASKLEPPMKAVTKEKQSVAYPLILIFVILSLGIVAGGAFYYRHYERQFRAEAGRQLSAIAELKVDELAQYRKERLWDAGAFFKNEAFSGLVQRFLDHPENTEAQQQLYVWAISC
jgi:hypothetical protein